MKMKWSEKRNKFSFGECRGIQNIKRKHEKEIVDAFDLQVRNCHCCSVLWLYMFCTANGDLLLDRPRSHAP